MKLRKNLVRCFRCKGHGVVERSAVAGGSFPTCPCCRGSGLQADVCETCLGAGYVHTHGGEKDPLGAGLGDHAPCPSCRPKTETATARAVETPAPTVDI